MKATLLSTLVWVAAAVQAGIVAQAQGGYVAPVASGYIYRSDNNGPASLIQLGAVPYPQPLAFAPSLPLAQPIKLEAIEAYDLEPAPLPYVAAKPIIEEDSDEGDEVSDEAEEYIDSGESNAHEHGHEKGGGSDYNEEHHAARGDKGSKGYSSKGHHAKGKSGHYGKEHDEGYHSEAKGEKSSHHAEAAAHGKHHEAGKNYKGANHGHKKHFSKGEDVSGYHKVFHKDEFKKDHKFYDVADNSGHFNKHGYQKAHRGSEEGGHKKGGHSKGGYAKEGFGKSGHHAKGHVDEAESGYSGEKGKESHFKHQKDFAKEGGKHHQKEYEYDDAAEDDEY